MLAVHCGKIPWQPHHGLHSPALRPPTIVPPVRRPSTAASQGNRSNSMPVLPPNPPATSSSSSACAAKRPPSASCCRDLVDSIPGQEEWHRAPLRYMRPASAPARQTQLLAKRLAAARSVLNLASFRQLPLQELSTSSPNSPVPSDTASRRKAAEWKSKSTSTERSEGKSSKKGPHSMTKAELIQIQRRLQRLAKQEPKDQESKEWLVSLVREGSLHRDLRLMATLELCRLHVRRGDVSRPECIELGLLIENESSLVSGLPFTAVELAEVLETPLDMAESADIIYQVMEQDAATLHGQMQYNYVLIDLVEWHKRRGRFDQARALWDKACAVPTRHRDPRTFSRTYGFSFPDGEGVHRTKEKKTRRHGTLATVKAVCEAEVGLRRPLAGPSIQESKTRSSQTFKLQQSLVARRIHLRLVDDDADETSEGDLQGRAGGEHRHAPSGLVLPIERREMQQMEEKIEEKEGKLEAEEVVQEEKDEDRHHVGDEGIERSPLPAPEEGDEEA